MFKNKPEIKKLLPRLCLCSFLFHFHFIMLIHAFIQQWMSHNNLQCSVVKQTGLNNIWNIFFLIGDYSEQNLNTFFSKV